MEFKSVVLFLIGFEITIMTMIVFVNTRKERQRLKSSQENDDRYNFRAGNDLYNNSEADELFEKVRILCIIMTKPANHKTKAVNVKNTWGKKCNKLLFITSQLDPELDTIIVKVNESRNALRNKTRDAFYYVHDNHLNDFDWFLKADDDR